MLHPKRCGPLWRAQMCAPSWALLFALASALGSQQQVGQRAAAAPLRELSTTGALLRAGSDNQQLADEPSGAVTIFAAARGVRRAKRQAAASSSSSSSSSGNKKNKKANKQLEAQCLAAHNKLRRLHKVPDLQWDDKLAAFAQKRSNHIAASDGAAFGHPPDLPYGENLFWHSNVDFACEAMVRGWYDEIQLYNFSAPTFAPETGHFTQLVWRDTQRVGCSVANSSGKRGGVYLTCSYDPAGNFVGEFPANVLRVVSVAPTAPAKPAKPATTVAPVVSTTTTSGAPLTTTAKPAPEQTDNKTTKPKSKKKKNKKKNKNKGKKKRKNKNKNKKKTTSTLKPSDSVTSAPSSATS